MVGSVASGRTCRATAALFGVSVASVVKWSQRWRATGNAAAKQMGGWRQLRLKREREWLLARIVEKPDLTLRAVVAELAERGTPASYGAVWRHGPCPHRHPASSGIPYSRPGKMAEAGRRILGDRHPRGTSSRFLIRDRS